MHYLMIAFTKVGENSEEAREHARYALEQDTSFVSDGGLFGSSVADWFVIGGRWSGHLQMLSDPKLKNYYKEIQKALKIKSNWGLSDKDIEQNKELIQKIWEKMGGKLDSPYLRDNYNHNGLEDDAIKCTRQLYKAIIKGKDIKIDYHLAKSDEWHIVAVDLDYDVLDESLDNKNQVGKWAVVVDYHN
jgi:hypothetical protein